jgi:hypothetical protein
VYTLDRYIDFERGVWSIGVTGCDLRDKLFIIRGIGIKDREKHAVSRKLRLEAPFYYQKGVSKKK